MFLKSLHILNEDVVIREILFKEGINLIVDETEGKSIQSSGNNVGKTTVLRLIHYCLGGSGDNIYNDREFKGQVNQEIQSFLTSNNIIIQLVITDDLNEDSSREIEIRRNFLKYSRKIQEINGEKIRNEDFQNTLKELIFNSDAPKPTFKQIVAKNIRDEKNRLSNTVRVLNPYTTDDAYEALYLFWLGIDLNKAERKQALVQQLKAEEKIRKRLERSYTIPKLNQFIAVVKRNIASLETQKKDFNLNENYELELNNLTKITYDLNAERSLISQLELRKELILESKEDLESNYSTIEASKVKEVYNRAKVLIPQIQKTFEETVDFHNRMIQEKLTFITEELPELEQSLLNKKRKVKELLENEKRLTAKLVKSSTIEVLERLIVKLNTAYEQKGKLEEQKRQLEEVYGNIRTKEQELNSIDHQIKSKDDLIQIRVEKFNEYFSELSHYLYNEQFILVPEKKNNSYSLVISTLSGNPGTGKKKGQIAAFDLAYILFAEDIGIECLHFILHDQIENVHENQISNLLEEIVRKVNCQYILPVLRDKLPTSVDISAYEILSLSQENKLFKV